MLLFNNRISSYTALLLVAAASSFIFQTSAAAAATINRRDDLSQCVSSNTRSEAIKKAFQHAYKGYVKYAFGHDELLPVSKKPSDSRNGWGATIIDALDTMIIMGLDEEYQTALKFVEKVDFSHSKDTSKGFETNIRYLGGLLSANDLKPDPILKKKAIEVADITLLPLFVDSITAFGGKNIKVPLTYLNVNTGVPQNEKTINLAEFGTYTMEFTRLSQITGDPKYEKLATDLINAAIEQPTKIPGLFPTSWTVKPFAPINKTTITIAGGGDSFYEYLIKNYLLQENKNPTHKQTWENSVESIEKYLLSPTLQNPGDIKFVAMIGNNKVYYTSQELICFWPGNILLGISQMQQQTEKSSQFKKFADTFFKSCIESWKKTETKIAPESWNWTPLNNDLGRKLNQLFDNTLKVKNSMGKKTTSTRKRASSTNNNNKAEKRAAEEAIRSFQVDNPIYDLRPETIESVFYYYRMTGETKYQDLAWSLFEAIDKYAKVEAGFTIVSNVDKLPIELQDFQESFFFAETLKYLYLTFSDKNCVSLNNYVFNTEAHPFKLSTPIEFQ